MVDELKERKHKQKEKNGCDLLNYELSKYTEQAHRHNDDHDDDTVTLYS